MCSIPRWLLGLCERGKQSLFSRGYSSAGGRTAKIILKVVMKAEEGGTENRPQKRVLEASLGFEIKQGASSMAGIFTPLVPSYWFSSLIKMCRTPAHPSFLSIYYPLPLLSFHLS